ncbi:unnamed protein product [Amoebophrya sp. A25]|nr:unnamed protein product [Amoebophrya sp. A25]|eukprot:GSA25T00026127001.1
MANTKRRQQQARWGSVGDPPEHLAPCGRLESSGRQNMHTGPPRREGEALSGSLRLRTDSRSEERDKNGSTLRRTREGSQGRGEVCHSRGLQRTTTHRRYAGNGPTRQGGQPETKQQHHCLPAFLVGSRGLLVRVGIPAWATRVRNMETPRRKIRDKGLATDRPHSVLQQYEEKRRGHAGSGAT